MTSVRTTAAVFVVPRPGAAAEAVMSLRRPLAQRLMGSRGVFDAKLSERCGAPLVCTPEFSQWWSGRPGVPCNFFAEVAP